MVMVTRRGATKEDVMAAKKAKKTTKAKKVTRKVKATAPRGMAKSAKTWGAGPGF
jgi:hypothetical protein